MNRAIQIAARLLEADSTDEFNDLLQRTGLGSTPEDKQKADLLKKKLGVNAPSAATAAKKPQSPHYPSRQYTPPERATNLKDFITQELSPEAEADRIKMALFATDWSRYMPTKVIVREGDDSMEVELHLIDERHRAKFAAMGSRVIGTPEQEPMESWLVRIMQAALRRAKMASNVAEVQVTPAHEGLDMEALPDDFEDDIGDWIVTFTFVPQ